MRWLNKIAVLAFMIKTINGYLPSEMETSSTIGFGLNSEKSYIIQVFGTGGGAAVAQGCQNGSPYGILLAITKPCPFVSPGQVPRGCTTGMPLGILNAITCP